MDEPFPKIAPASLLHRLLGLTPGYAPMWVCSRDSCLGIDIFAIAPTVIIIASFVLGHLLGSSWLPAVLPATIIFWIFVYLRFENRERWGRARRRRGECVWCGQAGSEPGSPCGKCVALSRP